MGVMATLKGISLARKGIGAVFNALGVPDSMPLGPIDTITGGRSKTDALLDVAANPLSLLSKKDAPGGPKNT